MPCVDKDKFNLADHGKDAGKALEQLMRVPAIAAGALGKVIKLIRQEVLMISDFAWVASNGNNVGSATGIWAVDKNATNKIRLKNVKVQLMLDKRSQVVHELVHALDMRYFYFNISHPPRKEGLQNRVPVLYLLPFGDVFKYNYMDVPFINSHYYDLHAAALTYFKGLVRNNSLLEQWQRDMLMTQLDYAARGDKLHAEYTANVAQCLALIYQWGFTGREKGFLGRPRSIALVIRKMESELESALKAWSVYLPPSRKAGAVIQFKTGDKRQPDLSEVHFSKDNWWKELGTDKPESLIA